MKKLNKEEEITKDEVKLMITIIEYFNLIENYDPIIVYSLAN